VKAIPEPFGLREKTMNIYDLIRPEIHSASDAKQFMYSCGSRNISLFDMFEKSASILTNTAYKNIYVSYSGGADSDIMLALCEMIAPGKCKYIWFDTGMEYEATKEHIVEVEKKYGVTIEKLKAATPVPVAVRKHGSPFLSKFVSQMLHRVQIHNFDFTDPEMPTSAANWWNNTRNTTKYGYSMFNIDYNKGLKDFIAQNPPDFTISDRCCDESKKKTSKMFLKTHDVDLLLVGLRKSEGGVRSAKINSCFDFKRKIYRPLFWLTNGDREEFAELFGVEFSKCYTEYGFKRTGCACCPFGGKNCFRELEVVKIFEPKLYKAVNYVFGDSYDYTRRYFEFKDGLK